MNSKQVKNLLNRHIRVLKKNPDFKYSDKRLAQKIGVGDSWLIDFKKGVHKDPSESRVEKVRKYLARQA